MHNQINILLHRYRIHRTTENVKFHVRQTHCCQKQVDQKTLSLILVSIKKYNKMSFLVQIKFITEDSK